LLLLLLQPCFYLFIYSQHDILNRRRIGIHSHDILDRRRIGNSIILCTNIVIVSVSVSVIVVIVIAVAVAVSVIIPVIPTLETGFTCFC